MRGVPQYRRRANTLAVLYVYQLQTVKGGEYVLTRR